MRKKPIESWVVYMMTLHGKADKVHAVCEQSEWDAMELARPGYHLLIQSGIANECDAERLARAKPADLPAAAARLPSRC